MGCMQPWKWKKPCVFQAMVTREPLYQVTKSYGCVTVMYGPGFMVTAGSNLLQTVLPEAERELQRTASSAHTHHRERPLAAKFCHPRRRRLERSEVRPTRRANLMEKEAET